MSASALNDAACRRYEVSASRLVEDRISLESLLLIALVITVAAFDSAVTAADATGEGKKLQNLDYYIISGRSKRYRTRSLLAHVIERKLSYI